MGIFSHMLAGGVQGSAKAWGETIDERVKERQAQGLLAKKNEYDIEGDARRLEGQRGLLELGDQFAQEGEKRKLGQTDYAYHKETGELISRDDYSKLPDKTGWVTLAKQGVDAAAAKAAWEARKLDQGDERNRLMEIKLFGEDGKSTPADIKARRDTLMEVDKIISEAGGWKKVSPEKKSLVRNMLKDVDLEVTDVETEVPGLLQRLTGGALGGTNKKTTHEFGPVGSGKKSGGELLPLETFDRALKNEQEKTTKTAPVTEPGMVTTHAPVTESGMTNATDAPPERPNPASLFPGLRDKGTIAPQNVTDSRYNGPQVEQPSPVTDAAVGLLDKARSIPGRIEQAGQQMKADKRAADAARSETASKVMSYVLQNQENIDARQRGRLSTIVNKLRKGTPLAAEEQAIVDQILNRR